MPAQSKGETAAALLAVFGVSATPIVAEWSVVLVGAMIGASLHISMEPPFRRWWEPVARWLVCVLAAIAFARVVGPLALQWLPSAGAVDAEAMLIASATAVAWGWRPALQRAGQMIGAWQPPKKPDGGNS